MKKALAQPNDWYAFFWYRLALFAIDPHVDAYTINDRLQPEIDEGDYGIGPTYKKMSEAEYLSRLSIHDAAKTGDLHVIKLLIRRDKKRMEWVYSAITMRGLSSLQYLISHQILLRFNRKMSNSLKNIYNPIWNYESQVRISWARVNLICKNLIRLSDWKGIGYLGQAQCIIS